MKQEKLFRIDNFIFLGKYLTVAFIQSGVSKNQINLRDLRCDNSQIENNRSRLGQSNKSINLIRGVLHKYRD